MSTPIEIYFSKMAIRTQPRRTQANLETRFGSRTNIGNSAKVSITGPLFNGVPTAAVARAASKTRKHVLSEVKEVTPVDTGLMRRSWYSKVDTKLSGVSLGLFNNVDYSGYVEYGTKHMTARRPGTQTMNQARGYFTSQLQKELSTELGGTIENIERRAIQGIAALLRGGQR